MKYTINDLKKSHPCCSSFVRDWSETDNFNLPPSEHSPKCGNYKTEFFWRIKHIDNGGGSFIVEKKEEAVDAVKEDDDLTYGSISLTRDQFNNLGDFEGF